MTFLLVVFVVLVLLLTGTFLPVVVLSFKFAGWLLVSVIAIALIWMLLARLFRPKTYWFQHRSAVRDLHQAIALRKKLGYETTDLDQKLKRLLE